MLTEKQDYEELEILLNNTETEFPKSVEVKLRRADFLHVMDSIDEAKV